jgi:hypothetical protein
MAPIRRKPAASISAGGGDAAVPHLRGDLRGGGQRPADYGAVPVENSTAGSINKSLRPAAGPRSQGAWRDLAARAPQPADSSGQRRCDHPGAQPSAGAGAVRKLSQPPSLRGRALVRHGWQRQRSGRQPGGRRRRDRQQTGRQVYGLEIVDEGIEDMPNNYTRFFVVGKGDPPRSERCKTSLVFAVPNTPGSLYHALGEFATRQVNLTKLESRPRRNRPGNMSSISTSTATGRTSQHQRRHRWVAEPRRVRQAAGQLSGRAAAGENGAAAANRRCCKFSRDEDRAANGKQWPA